MKFIKTYDQDGQILWINISHITDVRTLIHLGEEGITIRWGDGHISVFGQQADEFMLDFHAMIG
jgi:hypothetical protein